jgi:rhodanese-related sulfurtransferase
MKPHKTVAEIAIIILLGCVLGGAVNHALVKRYFAGEFRQSFLDQKKFAGLRFITLAETEDLWAAKTPATNEAVFIDSRTREEYASGHIPGALSVPLQEMQRGAGKADDLHWPEGTMPFSPDQILIVYCEGGDCRTSIALAQLIRRKGFKDIRIFSGGWVEWSAAGLPVEASK